MHKAAKAQFPKEKMLEFIPQLPAIRGHRNPIHPYCGKSHRNQRKKQQGAPIGDEHQLQHLHKINDVKIPDGRIDQEPACRREVLDLAIKYQCRKHNGKSQIAAQQLDELKHVQHFH